MKIVFFGSGAFGIPSLEVLKKSPHTLSAVFTTPDKPQGRNLKAQASPIKQWALENKIPVFDFSLAGSPQALKELNADLFIVISFGFILTKDVLSIPRLMTLNVHSSLLPKYRGAAPVPWAIIAGEKETGVTVMRMVEKLDAGDIVIQKKTEIAPDDTVLSIEERLCHLGASALLEAISHIEKGNAVFKPQNNSPTAYAKKLTKEDGLINWNQSAQIILNRLRAMVHWPGSYTFYKGKRIIVTRAAISAYKGVQRQAPGEIIDVSPHGGIVIATKDSPLAIQELQMEGKKVLSAQEFLKGCPMKPGESLQ